MAADEREPVTLEPAACCICGGVDGTPVGVGEDFEHRTSAHSFLTVRCPTCDVIYLDPRPTMASLGTIYPDDYPSFAFDEAEFGIVHKVRSRLEARRIMRAGKGLPANAHVLDVGCGDGFHLDLLRKYGPTGWQLHGIDTDPRAVAAARRRGLIVDGRPIEQSEIEPGSIDLALCIQTIEHVADPVAILRAIGNLLKPGGRLYLITDNTGSPDFMITKGRHWGGYHFPKHWYLFNKQSMRKLSAASNMDVAKLSTMTSPVNWTYSIRNALVDWNAPSWMIKQFSLKAAPTLAVFTSLDAALSVVGRGALLRVLLRRPQ